VLRAVSKLFDSRSIEIMLAKATLSNGAAIAQAGSSGKPRNSRRCRSKPPLSHGDAKDQ
jgi:hypothetical protein